MQSIILAIVGMVILVSSNAIAANGSIKGYMFGDYYYKASGPQKKQNAFHFRRIYFSYNKKWSDNFSGRLRFEAKDPGFGKNSTLSPFIKDAYLRYKKNGRSLDIGLIPTPTWNVTESLWGYRAIEKTSMDLNKISSSRDHGVAFRGRLDAAGKVNLQFMFANGNSNKSEGDNDKKVYAQLNLRPKGDLIILAYADWEGVDNSESATTVAAVIGIDGKTWRGGVEVFMKTQGDISRQGGSIFCSKQVKEKIKGFVRIDSYDPNTDVDDDAKTLVIGGLDIEPITDIHFMPNVRIMADAKPDVDMEIQPRITGYFKF